VSAGADEPTVVVAGVKLDQRGRILACDAAG